jgi:uncharacterized protein
MDIPEISQLDVCIYHDPCSDGFTAAWVCYLRFGEITFLPANHEASKTKKDYWIDAVRNKHALIVDYSFPRDTLEAMKAAAASLQVLDHHKSAQEALGDLPYCYFNTEHSGAALAWRACFPHISMPNLVSYVEDRDLARNQLYDTEEINVYIDSLERNFANWDRIALRLPYDRLRNKIIEAGKAILPQIERSIEEVCTTAEQWTLAGVPLLAANSYLFRGPVSEKLMVKIAHQVGGAYWIKSGRMTWSLRSTKYDVAALAGKFPNGGGHLRAAGFTVDIAEVDFVNRVINPV